MAIQTFKSLPLLFLATTLYATAQQPPKPKVSQTPLSADQLSIYKAILQDWAYDPQEPNKTTVRLAIQTTPADPSGDEDCGKSLALESPSNEVHRFRPEDLPQLGPAKIALIDPEAGSKEIAENDPGKNIRKGKSIADAVSNGFAHGLVTLSEIRFDKDHTHALLWYGFTCGSLCGNGATVILEKAKSGNWIIKSHCSDWIS